MMFSHTDTEVLRFLANRFLRPYWKTIIFFACLNAVMGMLFSLRPVVLAPALDFFVNAPSAPADSLFDINLSNIGATIRSWFSIGRGDYLGLGILVAFSYTFISALVSGIGFVSYWGNQKLRSLIRQDMTVAVHGHMLHLPLTFFHRHKSGKLLNYFTYDVVRTANGLDQIPREVIRAASRLAVTGTILVVSSAWLALLILLVGILHFWVTRWLSTRVKKNTRALAQKMADTTAVFQESVSGVRLIKSFAAERHNARKIRTVTDSLREVDVKSSVTSYTEDPVRLVLDSMLAGIILLFALVAVGHDILTMQAALMYFYLTQQSIEPVSILGKQLLAVQQLLASASPLMKLFQERSEIVDGLEAATPLRHSVTLQGVSFSYPDGAVVLKDINLTINKGEMVALVGPSGAGKSTLADMLLRFYDPTQGQITFDERDIRDFRLREYRRLFGVVSQDTLLFNATIRENIIFDKVYDENKLKHVIEVANASDFIYELPEGLDTELGDRGVRLSGGQRQRIAIARAVYHQPQLLILDEATSALDSHSEHQVQEALDRLAKEITVVAIAHRLSTVQHADKIVVMNAGRIEAVGRHEELLGMSPTYQQLCKLQLTPSVMRNSPG